MNSSISFGHRVISSYNSSPILWLDVFTWCHVVLSNYNQTRTKEVKSKPSIPSSTTPSMVVGETRVIVIVIIIYASYLLFTILKKK